MVELPAPPEEADDQPILASAVDEWTAQEPVSRPPRLPGPGFWAALGWTLLLMVVLNGASIFLMVVLMVAGLDQDEVMRIAMPVSSGIMLVLALTLNIAFFGSRIGRVLALRAPSIRHTMLTVLLVAPLAIVMQEVAAWAGEVLPTFNGEIYAEFAKSHWVLVFLAGCLLPGVSEELFFRGFIGRGLLARLGVWWGTLWCAFLFAAIHLDPTQIVGILVIGVALQLVLLSSRSLLIPMLLHTLNNLLSFTAMKLGALADVDHVPPPIVIAALVVLLPLAMLFYRSRRHWQLPDGEHWNPGYLTAESPPPEVEARAADGPVSIAWLLLMVACYAAFVAACVRWLEFS